MGSAPRGQIRRISSRPPRSALLLQKLEALGRLTSGVAHEIATPTQFVVDNLEFLDLVAERLAAALADVHRAIEPAVRGEALDLAALATLHGKLHDSVPPDLLAELPAAIAGAREGLRRISGIVRALNEYAHPAGGDKQLVDVNECVRMAATVARGEWRRVAELELDLDPSLLVVPCLRDELGQAMVNLVVNAAHAVASGRRPGRVGHITVRTRELGSAVEIRVEDDGCGIPDDVLPRIFDPFFTTKPPGRGTGQGLAIVRHVVALHGGTIDVDSLPGRGTTFVVVLPR